MTSETIRNASLEDAPAIAHAHIDSWRTTYKDIIPAAYLASFSYDERVQRWTRILGFAEARQFTYVATDEQDHAVGFVRGGRPQQADEHEYSSELYAIYLLASYQGRGLGRLLTKYLVESLVQAGMYSLFLWVLKDNPARHFYEALGGQLIRTQPITIGGATLEEVAYGWQDIRGLLL